MSHSTDVGCISEETKVKKLLLAGTTVLLMATSANAGPEADHTSGIKSQGYAMGDHGRFHGYLALAD